MKIDLGRGDGTVTQEFLDEAEIHTAVQQEAGEGVTEGMGRDVAVDPGQFCVLGNHISDGLGGQGLGIF